MKVESTPPPTTDHPLEHYYQEAELGGYYYHSTIYDCDYPPEIIAELMREAGGENSLTWRIEYMAERGLVDDTLKIVPSFDKETKHDHGAGAADLDGSQGASRAPVLPMV
jgi:hypothetical protein